MDNVVGVEGRDDDPVEEDSEEDGRVELLEAESHSP